MPNATFRIENVSIEGFKAFTNQQTFHFGGRHVFLLDQTDSEKLALWRPFAGACSVLLLVQEK